MSKSETVWLLKNKMTLLTLSSMSPHLNPIENLNKLSITKKPSGNRKCNHGRIRENPRKILLKFLIKF